MTSLPAHGRVACAACYDAESPMFDQTERTSGPWRIVNNPLAWGCASAPVVVLGFSKGPTQRGALTRLRHEDIAYAGGRSAVAKILHHIRLLPRADPDLVNALIADREGLFHFGSLIRCTVERFDHRDNAWVSTGGGMLDNFVATDFGRAVSTTCGRKFLRALPRPTRLIVMMGLGTNLGYVHAARKLFEDIRPGSWYPINDVAYSDGRVTVVHTEHFKVQGAHLENWLGKDGHGRGKYGVQARRAVRHALGL